MMNTNIDEKLASKKIKDEYDLQNCVFCKAPKKPPEPWTTGKIIGASAFGAGVAALIMGPVAFISPAFRKICLPFIPATPSQMRNITTALKGRQGRLLDVGSGDGRIVIEASRLGFQADGVELNGWLVLYSRFNSWRKGQKHAQFYKKDLWKFDFSPYNNIVVFGVENLMEPLEEKLEREIDGDCEVLTSRFPLPKWKPVRIIGEGLDTVWVYSHPDKTRTCGTNEQTVRTDERVSDNKEFKGLQWTVHRKFYRQQLLLNAFDR